MAVHSCALGLCEEVADARFRLRANHLGDDLAVLEGKLWRKYERAVSSDRDTGGTSATWMRARK